MIRISSTLSSLLLFCLPGIRPPGHTQCARQAGRMVTKSCLGSFKHFCDSGNESVFIHVRCNIFIQSTHWLFLIEWPVSICQNNSLGTKPLAQGGHLLLRAQLNPKRLINKCMGSDRCQERWCHVQALVLLPLLLSALFARMELLQLSYYSKQLILGFGAGTSFSLSVCPVLWSTTTAPAFCSDRNDNIAATRPNGFVHNTLHSRDLKKK